MFSGSCAQSQDCSPNHPISSRLSRTLVLADSSNNTPNPLKMLGWGGKTPNIKKNSYFG